MESEIIISLVAAVFLITVFCISLITRLIHVKNRMREISATLDDISTGHINHKILARPDEITAAICYQINGIVSRCQDRLIELKKAHDLKEYIDVLFDWFKLNSNEETISREPHEIAELTRNLLKDWIPVFEEKALDYDIDIPQRRLMASVDFDGYAHVIGNLIQNVIAHSGASKIEISLFLGSAQIGRRGRPRAGAVSLAGAPFAVFLLWATLSRTGFAVLSGAAVSVLGGRPLRVALSSILNSTGEVSEETATVSKEIIQKIGEEGMVLLKNSNQLLPLSSDTQKLIVLGRSGGEGQDLPRNMTIRAIGVTEEMLPGLVQSTLIMEGGYKVLTQEEILKIFKESM